MLIAACIIVPQILVAFLSPAIGSAAQRWGRRPLLIAGFAALPIKGLCLALVTAPQLLVAAQFLDGISAAAVGVLVPLIAADITRTKEREAAGDDMDVDDDAEDPVPELTKRHFEEAMQMARKSVGDVEIRRYEAFAQQMKNAGPGAFFKFPSGGVDGGAASGGNNEFGNSGDDDGLYD